MINDQCPMTNVHPKRRRGHWTLDIGHWTLDIAHWSRALLPLRIKGSYFLHEERTELLQQGSGDGPIQESAQVQRRPINNAHTLARWKKPGGANLGVLRASTDAGGEDRRLAVQGEKSS